MAVLLLWGATRLLLLVLALNPELYSGAITGDVRGYGAKVERMFQGEMPYRDVAIEYPPGSVPFTILPGLIVGTGEHYRLAFALTMLAVDAVGLYASVRLARAVDRRAPAPPAAARPASRQQSGPRDGADREGPHAPAAASNGSPATTAVADGDASGDGRAGSVQGMAPGTAPDGAPGAVPGAVRARIPVAYTLGALALGPVMYMRFDLVPAVCVLLAAAFAAERRPGRAAAALGYGAAAKLFPVVLAPLLVLALIPRLGWGRVLGRTVPPFALAFGLTVVPALAVSFQGTIASAVVYHMDRGVQIESLWASGLALAHVIGDLPAHTAHQFGAYDIFTTWSEEAKTLSTVATAVALLAACGLVWWRARLLYSDGHQELAGQEWTIAFAIGVLAFMLPTRVLSPQYLIWLMPMVAVLIAHRRARWALGLLTVAGFVTQLIFPFRYTQLRNLEAFEVGLLAARNALLVATAVVLVRSFLDRKTPERPPASASVAEPSPSVAAPRPSPDASRPGSDAPKQPVRT